MPDAVHTQTINRVRLIAAQIVRGAASVDAPDPIDVFRALLEGALGAGVETLGCQETYDVAQAMLDDIALQVADGRARAAQRGILR